MHIDDGITGVFCVNAELVSDTVDVGFTGLGGDWRSEEARLQVADLALKATAGGVVVGRCDQCAAGLDTVGRSSQGVVDDRAQDFDDLGEEFCTAAMALECLDLAGVDGVLDVAALPVVVDRLFRDTGLNGSSANGVTGSQHLNDDPFSFIEAVMPVRDLSAHLAAYSLRKVTSSYCIFLIWDRPKGCASTGVCQVLGLGEAQVTGANLLAIGVAAH